MTDNISLQSHAAVLGQQGSVEYVQLPVGTSLAQAERVLIFATLELCHGNKTRAANMLGVSLKTLYNRINEYRSEPA